VRSKILRALEIATLLAGVALIALFAVARIDGYFASRAAIEHFEAAAKPPAAPALGRALPSAVATGVAKIPSPARVDFSLWSAGRIRAYRESLARDFAPAIALLEIPKIGLVVPVFDGTSDLILNRGVGRIAGAARPGQHGNLAIAGHRDGFFRGLKDVRRGDVVEIEIGRPRETLRYRVDRIEIVGPRDVSVLAPRRSDSLTLVTCYPFYYIGSAPKRFVVEASLESGVQNHGQRSVSPKSEATQGEERK
jgi:sortase A